MVSITTFIQAWLFISEKERKECNLTVCLLYLSIRDEQEFVELVEDEAGGLMDSGHYSFVMVPGVGL